MRKCKEIDYLCDVLLNGVAGIQKEMKQTIVSTYANRLLPVGIFYFIKNDYIHLFNGKP
jgi:hypothetical protein